jgi:hypothetical protein
MTAPRGYNLTLSLLARIQLLDWIYENGGDRPGRQVHIGQRYSDIDHDDALAIRALALGLADEGVIEYQTMFSWGSDFCKMTPLGLRQVEDLRAARQDVRLRYIATQDALLEWLYTRAGQGNSSPQVSVFLSSPWGSFYGDPITEKEVGRATNRLLADGYISGEASYGGGVGRPVITSKGEHLVEQGRSVGDSRDAPAGSVYNTTVRGSPGATIAQGSPAPNRR